MISPTPTLAHVVLTTILLLLVLVIVLVLTTVLFLLLVLTTILLCNMYNVTTTLLPDVGEQLTVCSGPSYGRRSGHCHETTG